MAQISENSRRRALLVLAGRLGCVLNGFGFPQLAASEKTELKYVGGRNNKWRDTPKDARHL